MSSLHEYYNSGDDSEVGISSGTGRASQSFTTTSAYEISSVKLKIYRDATTTGTMTVDLKAVDGDGKPTGSALATSTINKSTIETSPGWVEFTFSSPYVLSATTQYTLVMGENGVGSSILIRKDGSSPTYSDGTGKWYSNDSGSSWYAVTDRDYMFENWGGAGLPADKTYSKGLVAIANNELWYETSAGTMAEFSDATGNIDTANPLTAVEAYQKLFITNKTNLKVADFINTKITTTDAGANPCTKGMTLTGSTYAAAMIVDYADGVTDDSAANVYGYRTTAATFVSGETVTGTNSAGNAVSFVLSANEDAPPHWYNWTVFGNDTATYGTMPASSSIIALYRGRIVFNDDNRPNAWYMTKVEDPWKVLYDYTNDGDLSAVTYTNTTVGKIGDILTAIIPYKDDLLIWGCATSIWILVGDPLGSGQNARVTNQTGIWGPHAWCIGEKSNLYFLGDDGIYRMPISESYSPPENISKLKMPNLLTTLDLDKSLHRVTFGFDPIKFGIHICKTVLLTGTSTNYWYDLMTGGFYPESYPTSCGVFSSYFYPATDDTYKKYLLGSFDGYIREFDDATENDATTSSTSAITSYAAIVGRLSDDEDHEGVMTWINATTSGGASSGDFADSDSVEYSLFPGDDAETVLEDIKDGATAFASGTWDGAGKQTKNRTRMRGVWYGLKIGNDDASETWSLNNIYCNIKKAGKLR